MDLQIQPITCFTEIFCQTILKTSVWTAILVLTFGITVKKATIGATTKQNPIAAQIENSKIGNQAYVIDEQNRDNYPLMEPFSITSQDESSPTSTASQVSEPADSPIPANAEVLAVSVAGLAGIVAGLVIYGKQRRR